MKEFGLWLSLLVSSLSAASAQVTVEILQEQDQFLPGESVPAAVRIINRSGQTLRLGKEQDWLAFSVESLDGLVAAKTGEVPVAGEFVLDSSKMATKRVDLAPYFSLGVPGHYTVLATVRITDWDHRVTSPPKGFDIIQGAKLWEQEFGVPEPAGATNAAPEVRRYILQQANYLKASFPSDACSPSAGRRRRWTSSVTCTSSLLTARILSIILFSVRMATCLRVEPTISSTRAQGCKWMLRELSLSPVGYAG